MVFWAVLFLVTLAGVSGTPEPAFPEAVNERLERSSDPFASRIVSGWEAKEGQLPYQLSIRMVNDVGGVSSCGGSIIHEEWGLTAAHCTATRWSFVVRAGTVNLTTPALIFEATEYYNHPDYINELQSIVQPNDISLLKFGRKIEFNSLIQPIRVQSSRDMNKDYSGIVLVASGWGRTWTNGASPENLNWVYLRGTSNLLCRLTYGNSPIIVDSTICASYYNVTSQSTCQGDSGGLLTAIDSDGQVTQVGVTSFVSATGCHTDIPAGFIRPGHYHDWFRSVTDIDFDWNTEEETTVTEPTTTEAPTTEAATTEPASSEEETSESASSEESSSESESSEEDSTEAATTEPPTTEAATTVAASSEEDSSESESSEEATTATEAATTEVVTEAPTTEAASSEEESSESESSEEATTATEAATTEVVTEAPTTEAASSEEDSSESESSEEATTATEAATTEVVTEVPTTEAVSSEEDPSESASSESESSEVATTEAATTVAEASSEENPTEPESSDETPTVSDDQIVVNNFFNRYLYRFW